MKIKETCLALNEVSGHILGTDARVNGSTDLFVEELEDAAKLMASAKTKIIASRNTLLVKELRLNKDFDTTLTTKFDGGVIHTEVKDGSVNTDIRMDYDDGWVNKLSDLSLKVWLSAQMEE